MSSAELRENRTLGQSASGDGRKGENNPKQFLKTLSPMGTISDAKDRGLRLRGGTKTVGADDAGRPHNLPCSQLAYINVHSAPSAISSYLK